MKIDFHSFSLSLSRWKIANTYKIIHWIEWLPSYIVLQIIRSEHQTADTQQIFDVDRFDKCECMLIFLRPLSTLYMFCRMEQSAFLQQKLNFFFTKIGHLHLKYATVWKHSMHGYVKFENFFLFITITCVWVNIENDCLSTVL